MIIDCHTHAWPEKVALKARENLESLFKIKFIGDPTVSTLLSYMDKNDIDVSCVCAVATKAEQVPSINEWMFKIRQERLRSFCALHPDYSGWKEELNRIKERGDGIKLQPEFQGFYVDEARVFPIYAEMERLGLTVIFHCGEELSGTMLVRSSPQRMLRVREEFPKLKIIAAHFGGFQMLKEVRKYLCGKDIYLDTSFFFGHVTGKEAKEAILAHCPDRLLFGTDFPLIDQKQDIDYIKMLDIPDALKERIMHQNARELLGI